MSEAFDWAALPIVNESAAEAPEILEIVERPRLELVQELMPAFISSHEDREWWQSLPRWRKDLYLLPRAENESERIGLINALGITVVSYAGGKPTSYRPAYPTG